MSPLFEGAPACRVVAEISANHLGSLDRALDLVSAAKATGAWAVKFQTYTPYSMLANQDHVIAAGPWAGRKMAELYREAATPHEWHEHLFSHARSIGILPFSSAFSLNDLDLLERLDCALYKVASFELIDLPLISAIARTGKPMILSTGMATFPEIDQACRTAREAGCKDITLLKCTSGYPAPAEEVNLATIPEMERRCDCDRVGFSDHTVLLPVPIAAAAMGARVIEAHLTIARADGGPDAAFSYQPREFAVLVHACGIAAQAIGRIHIGPTASEIPQRALRRSLYWASSWLEGKRLEVEMVRTARPALGLSPAQLHKLVGRTLQRGVKAGDPVLEEDFER